MTTSAWRLLGFLGQAIFASRFLVQWLTSEHRGRSVIPVYFWYASMAGAVILLGYAISIKDPVFIVGQSFGMVVYSRNLWLIRHPQTARGDA